MYLKENITKNLYNRSNVCEKDEILQLINKLRFLMIDCRKESRISIIEACQLIQVDKKKSARYFAYNMLRTLEEILGKKPIFRNPGDKTLTFDEQWLASLILGFKSNDLMSIKFLMKSRVENLSKRSYISYLIEGLVKDLKSL